MTYKEAHKVAKLYDASLQATDKRFRGAVHLILQDGASFFYPDAFLMRIEDGGKRRYVACFTEHYGFSVFDEEDLLKSEEYTRSASYRAIDARKYGKKK